MDAFLGQDIAMDGYSELKSSFQVTVIEIIPTERATETTMSISLKRNKQTEPLSREGMRGSANVMVLMSLREAEMKTQLVVSARSRLSASFLSAVR